MSAISSADVLLEQAEEGLHGGVIGAGPDPAHRPLQAGGSQGPDEGVGAELPRFKGSSQHRLLLTGSTVAR